MTTPTNFSKLSTIQRRLLLRHIEGPTPIERTGTRGQSTVDCLIRSGFLQGYPNATHWPRLTELTEKGRHAVARILSEYAEALIAAGCLEIDPALPNLPNDARPIKMLARLKTRRKQAKLIGSGVGMGENNPREAVDNP